MPSLLRREFEDSLFPPVPHGPIVAWHPQHLLGLQPTHSSNLVAPLRNPRR